jgi:hypothetical protein
VHCLEALPQERLPEALPRGNCLEALPRERPRPRLCLEALPRERFPDALPSHFRPNLTETAWDNIRGPMLSQCYPNVIPMLSQCYPNVIPGRLGVFRAIFGQI